jgi:hypothetical protein
MEDYRGPKPIHFPPAGGLPTVGLPSGMRAAPRDAVSTEPVGRPSGGTGLR